MNKYELFVFDIMIIYNDCNNYLSQLPSDIFKHILNMALQYTTRVSVYKYEKLIFTFYLTDSEDIYDKLLSFYPECPSSSYIKMIDAIYFNMNNLGRQYLYSDIDNIMSYMKQNKQKFIDVIDNHNEYALNIEKIDGIN